MPKCHELVMVLQVRVTGFNYVLRVHLELNGKYPKNKLSCASYKNGITEKQKKAQWIHNSRNNMKPDSPLHFYMEPVAK